MNIKVKHAKNVPDISAKEALECMKKSLYLSMGMDIKTSLYLERMFAYKKYCMRTTRDNWTMAVYGLVMSVNDRDLDELEKELNAYEKAGELLQRLSAESIDEVALSYSQETSREYLKDFVELLILVYSEFGLEFDEALMRINDGKSVQTNKIVEEVSNNPDNTLNANKRGMSKAEDVMDRFMEKLNNNEFPKVTEPKSREEFIPTDEEIERISEGFQEILRDIKRLDLK